MNKEEKQEVIEALKSKFSQYSNFYITDTESLSVGQINNLRRHCYDKQVEMKVAKNTLIKKALESLDNEKYSGVYDSLQKVTALMFSESPKDPAVIISSFRKAQNGEKPQLKAAFLNGDIFVGDNQLINLTKIKTKNELIGEVIGLLMSPIQRVIGALQNRPETAEAKAPEASVVKTESAPEAKVEVSTEVKIETAEAPKAEVEAPKVEAPQAEAAKTDSVDVEKGPEA
jgi:large subunit ribosomal protein L10